MKVKAWVARENYARADESAYTISLVPLSARKDAMGYKWWYSEEDYQVDLCPEGARILLPFRLRKGASPREITIEITEA